MPALPDETSHGVLLKEQLGSALKQVIATGRLHTGQRVVEIAWPQEFCAAQASVREAINLLITEGFLVKNARRSARVANYREQDVRHIYQVGNPILAGQCVQHCIRPFAASAYAVWENVEGSIEAHYNGHRPRGRKGQRVDA